MKTSLNRTGRAPGRGAVGYLNARHFRMHRATEKVVGPSPCIGGAGNAHRDKKLGRALKTQSTLFMQVSK